MALRNGQDWPKDVIIAVDGLKASRELIQANEAEISRRHAGCVRVSSR